MKIIAKRCLAALLCAPILPLSFLSCDKASGDPSATSTTEVTTAPDSDPEPVYDPNWVSAIFGGGPFVTGGPVMVRNMTRSGFNTLMLWSVHVNADGDLSLNDLKVCEDGKYVGEQSWADSWKELKKESSTIKRIELSIGAWSTPDFENIKALIERDGTGEDTILYRNFQALIEVTGADAVNYDDESCYDADSAVMFGKMCETMGVKVTLCPFTNMPFWVNVKNRLGEELVDRVYLQCYDGGAGNVVSEWEDALGMKIIPGYWNITNGTYGKSAEQVGEELALNKRSITGGFMWYYDEMKSNRPPNATEDYAKAINEAQFD